MASRTIYNQKLHALILEIYAVSKKRLGANKICFVLSRDYGISISAGKVYRLMKTMHFPKISTVKPQDSLPSCYLLNQQFHPQNPNQVWVSDMTYIKTGSTFSYLCVVLDLFARKIISFHVANKANTALVINTVSDAIKKGTLLPVCYFILIGALNLLLNSSDLS